MRFFLTCVFLYTFIWADSPDWFYKLEPANKYEIIGYGDGKTLNEARLNAKNDIAKTISSHISSSFESQTFDKNSNIEHSVKEDITESSELVISDVMTMKEEEKDDKFFVALKYENLSLLNKLIKYGNTTLCGKANLYLSKTILLQKLSQELNCSAAVELTRDNNQWYLGHNKYRNIITSDNLRSLMIETSSNNLHLQATQLEVREDETYSLKIENIASRGYLSIFDLYEDGRVVLMESNIDLTKLYKTKLLYPEEIKKELQLSGGVLKVGHDSLDLFVVIVSEKPLLLSSFIPMGQEIEKSEMAFGADHLFELMEKNSFATTVVINKAREK